MPSPRKFFVSLLFALLSFALPVFPALGSTPTGEDEDDPKWCRACHRESHFTADEMQRTVHADLTCRECHTGYQFNPHEPVEEPDEPAITALREAGLAYPVAAAACAGCHDTQVEELHDSAHGKALFETKSGAYCAQCHGDSHEIRASSDVGTAQRRQEMSARCASCHTLKNDAHAAEGGEPAADAEDKPKVDVVGAYELSMHGRKLHLESEKAPGCADCHGSHALRDLEKEGGEACAKCHEGATQTLVAAALHITEGPGKGEDQVMYYTKKFFAWLTFLTILMLCIHVLLDLTARLRQKALRKVHHSAAPTTEFVQRFDLHQRLQHALMALSFTTLVLTGWPLSAHKIGTSTELMTLFGGVDRCGLLHRMAGVGLIGAAVYHLAYVVVMFSRRKLTAGMVWSLKDVEDLFNNLRMFIDPRRTRPRFPRYSYFEKFDYWAVFWGVVIMAGSGLVLWFPAWTAKVAPPWFFSIVRVAHADEAVLALLAIFLWHFYNVHLRPSVFPMSRVFIDGRMSLHDLEEEHGAEYDALMAKQRLQTVSDPPSTPEPVPPDPTPDDPESGGR